ncbi:dihydrofolate reductase family protein [Aurantibacillus circumpalustris]|uniref:dihydrofolate reductase family protein n=1 Tax=Aurantibacillus circumpalustris TaxID=3036359 RepID=UPI00295AC772|nr:dihydrofolate reductase family protein [Aurantibacillus circumpalustris]
MRKINSFTFLTLNGFYKGPGDDTSWHKHGEEESKFSEQQLEAGNILLFGKTTFEMMQSFWPTPMAAELFPKVAKGMNEAEKIVISNSLKKTDWKNTKILRGDIIKQIQELKASKGKNITILGSGSIVSLLTNAELIDEYQIMIDPVAITKGTAIFNNITTNLDLKLTESRVFKSSGTVLLTYKKV